MARARCLTCSHHMFYHSHPMCRSYHSRGSHWLHSLRPLAVPSNSRQPYRSNHSHPLHRLSKKHLHRRLHHRSMCRYHHGKQSHCLLLAEPLAIPSTSMWLLHRSLPMYRYGQLSFYKPYHSTRQNRHSIEWYPTLHAHLDAIPSNPRQRGIHNHKHHTSPQYLQQWQCMYCHSILQTHPRRQYVPQSYQREELEQSSSRYGSHYHIEFLHTSLDIPNQSQRQHRSNHHHRSMCKYLHSRLQYRSPHTWSLARWSSSRQPPNYHTGYLHMVHTRYQTWLHHRFDHSYPMCKSHHSSVSHQSPHTWSLARRSSEGQPHYHNH